MVLRRNSPPTTSPTSYSSGSSKPPSSRPQRQASTPASYASLPSATVTLASNSTITISRRESTRPGPRTDKARPRTSTWRMRLSDATGQGLHGLSVMPGGLMTGLQVHAIEQVSAGLDGAQQYVKSPEQGASTTGYAALSKE